MNEGGKGTVQRREETMQMNDDQFIYEMFIAL